VGGNVSVTQGDGGAADGPQIGDSVAIGSATVGGTVSVAQGDGGAAPGSPLGDVVEIALATVGGNVTVTQGDGASDLVGFFSLGSPNTIGGNLSISQGNGDGDTIVIEDTAVSGNASLEVGNGTGDTIAIEAPVDDGLFTGFTGIPDGIGVTFHKDVSITFGNGGDATLDVGTDGDPVSFAAGAIFSAGGTGNTYDLGPDVSFLLGQPQRHNI
jgi:hypothetical protein